MPRRVPLLAVLVLSLGVGACSRSPRAARAPDATRPTDEATSLVGTGDVARREGRAEDALRAYESALAARPRSIPTHLRYVAALLALGRRSVARDVYAARAKAVDALPVDRVMSERLSGDGSAASVRAVYVRAARSYPDDPWWRLALAEIDLASADRWIRKSEALRESGDSSGADRAVETARGALERATSAVEHAAERAPGLAEVDLYRGVLASLEGDLASGDARTALFLEAAAAFRRAVARDPSLVDAWADLADATYRAGDPAGALDAWVEAIRLAPGEADLREGAGLSLHDLGRNAEAAGQYVEAARAAPAEAGPLVRAGDSWAAAESWDKALTAYDKALDRDPTLVEVYAKKGSVFERAGRPAEARRAYAAYLSHGGPYAADVRRRFERLATAEGGP